MSTAFKRITELLDQIALEKSGKHEVEPSVKDKVGTAETGAFARDDNNMIDKANMRQPKYGQEGNLSAKHGQPRWAGTFTGTDPENENSKHIYDLTIDFRKYVNKTAAASVPVEELLQDAASLGNSLLAEILQSEQAAQGYDPQGAAKTAAAAVQNQASGEGSSVPQSATQQQSTGAQADASSVDPLQVIGLSGGVVYGLQKQAEYHADLVAQYLYGELCKKYAADDKALEEAVNTLGGETPVTDSEGDAGSESSGSSEAESDAESSPSKKKEIADSKELEKTLTPDTEEDAEESNENTEKNEESAEESEEPGDAAGQALADHAAEGAVEESLSDEDIMNSLGAALAELGMSPEELGQLGGPAGQKLASAFNGFRRTGNFKLEPARTRVKRAARDFIKGYILDLIRPGGR